MLIISVSATSASLANSFLICSTVEPHRICKFPISSSHSTTNPTNSDTSSTQQVNKNFCDELVRKNALIMDQLSIVDTLAKITRVPNEFDSKIQLRHRLKVFVPGLLSLLTFLLLQVPQYLQKLRTRRKPLTVLLVLV